MGTITSPQTMAAPQSSDSKATCSSRKRPSSQSLDDVVPKPQKKAHPPFPLTIFWDQLAEIPLTSNALRELHRRALVASHDPVTGQNNTQGDKCRVEHQPVPPVQISPALLKRIRRIAKNGGPDLSALRGHKAPFEVYENMSIRHDSTKLGSAAAEQAYRAPTPESMGPYDTAFEQHPIDHHILPDDHEYPDGQMTPEPGNMHAIRAALERPRASPSAPALSDTDFHKFCRANRLAKTARQVISTIVPTLEGEIVDRKCVAGGIPLNNFDHLTNGTLAVGSPDFYYGARPEQLAMDIRKQLGGHIVPSTQHDLPILPNFFLQAKGSNASMEVALRQACYNGALGARAMHTLLQSYGQSVPRYDNKAYVLTSSYLSGTLTMFTVHPLPPAKSNHRPGFAMTVINSWSMIGNYTAFLQAVTAYQNGLDWAKQQRDEAIAYANAIAAMSNGKKRF